MAERLPDDTFDRLTRAAWIVRDNARVLGPTKVGCAVLAQDGRIFAGCNIEHRFRCHDVHAEIGALATMIAAGATALGAIVIAADRQEFTPCGGCMDWIMELGGANVVVGFQGTPNGPLTIYRAGELMPHYPK